MVVGVGVCAPTQVSLGAPGKRPVAPSPTRGSPPPRQAPRSCRAPPIPLGLDTRKAGIGKWHLFLFLWLYLGGSGMGWGRVLWLVEDSPLGQSWEGGQDFFAFPIDPRIVGWPWAYPVLCPAPEQ